MSYSEREIKTEGDNQQNNSRSDFQGSEDSFGSISGQSNSTDYQFYRDRNTSENSESTSTGNYDRKLGSSIDGNDMNNSLDNLQNAENSVNSSSGRGPEKKEGGFYLAPLPVIDVPVQLPLPQQNYYHHQKNKSHKNPHSAHRQNQGGNMQQMNYGYQHSPYQQQPMYQHPPQHHGRRIDNNNSFEHDVSHIPMYAQGHGRGGGGPAGMNQYQGSYYPSGSPYSQDQFGGYYERNQWQQTPAHGVMLDRQGHPQSPQANYYPQSGGMTGFNSPMDIQLPPPGQGGSSLPPHIAIRANQAPPYPGYINRSPNNAQQGRMMTPMVGTPVPLGRNGMPIRPQMNRQFQDFSATPYDNQGEYYPYGEQSAPPSSSSVGYAENIDTHRKYSNSIDKSFSPNATLTEASAPAALPIVVPKAKLIELRDKDGNLVDLNSFRKRSQSAASQDKVEEDQNQLKEPDDIVEADEESANDISQTPADEVNVTNAESEMGGLRIKLEESDGRSRENLVEVAKDVSIEQPRQPMNLKSSQNSPVKPVDRGGSDGSLVRAESLEEWEVVANRIATEKTNIATVRTENELPVVDSTDKDYAVGVELEESSVAVRKNVWYSKDVLLQIYDIMQKAGQMKLPQALALRLRETFGNSNQHPSSTRAADSRGHSTNSPMQTPGSWKNYAHANAGRGGRHTSKPSVRPEKKITDPSEQLKREMKLILNKITPQSFEKLTKAVCDYDLTSFAMLQVLVKEIFEKAVDEAKYANIYAEMCSKLQDSQVLKHLSFIQVTGINNGNFIWIRDLEASNKLAGPFHSEDECVQAATSANPPPLDSSMMTGFSTAFQGMAAINDVLIRVYRKVGSDAFFMNYISLEELRSMGCVSDGTFDSVEAAWKNALNGHTIRRLIIEQCQEEYSKAVAKEGIYGSYEPLKLSFDRDVSAGVISPNATTQEGILEYATRETDLECLRVKIKQRRLGNVRFIGELSKMKLMPLKIVIRCIQDILAKEENNQTVWRDFKNQSDEDSSLEVLCHLLRTSGKQLDESYYKLLNAYFGQLKILSEEKSIASRLRFNLMEIIDFRNNGWQERREQEKPQMLQQIHANDSRSGQQKSLLHGNARPSGDVRAVRTPIIVRKPNGPPSGQGQVRTPPVSARSPLQSRSFDFAQTAIAEPVPPAPAKPAEYEFNESVHNKLCSIFRDFIKPGKAEDAIERLEDAVSDAEKCGIPFFGCHLIMSFIENTLDYKPAEQSQLLSLLAQDEIVRCLISSKKAIEVALLSCNSIISMHESLSDYRSAPEWIGSVLRTLIRIDACSRQAVEASVNLGKSSCLEDEFADHAAGSQGYERLLNESLKV